MIYAVVAMVLSNCKITLYCREVVAVDVFVFNRFINVRGLGALRMSDVAFFFAFVFDVVVAENASEVFVDGLHCL